ncbi:agamous-like MADS-box protein AGL30 [Senna tora]|uniref:Agamous-like MADS-box protein AGL30 n=1 Tax=Senna tora TaxID=362788 RepID=A0A834TXB2_9FABA|nr:agamous-like MADS-box protein AGL30 [Senna tora]
MDRNRTRIRAGLGSRYVSVLCMVRKSPKGTRSERANGDLLIGLPILPLLSMTDFAAHPIYVSSLTVFYTLFIHSPNSQLSTPSFFIIRGMGRVKLKIKRLENTNGRQATFAKRKHGILKKATELSILCDIDIILLMFSPTGKPSLCRGRRSNIEEVIAKFAQLTPQERAKRKLEGLEALKKTFRKLDHDVNIQEFLGTSSQTIEDLRNQTMLLQSQISVMRERLSHWSEPDKINSVEQLGQMESSLRESIDRIRTRKENIQKQQIVKLQCTNQFNEMQIPYRMSAEQHLQSLSWITNSDTQHIVLPEDSGLLLHKDLECSASSSFGSFASYVGSSMKTEMSNSGQENGVLSELSSTAPMRLQASEQFPYGLPYNFNLLNDTKFQPGMEMSPPENPIDYHVNGNFEAPRPGYDNNHHGWTSTSGSSAVNLFDEHLYAQASPPQVHFSFS